MSIAHKYMLNADAHNYLESRERADSLSPVSERGGEEDLLVKGEGRGDRGDMGDRGELQGGPPPPPPPSRFRTCSWLRATSRRSTSPSFSVSCSTTWHTTWTYSIRDRVQFPYDKRKYKFSSSFRLYRILKISGKIETLSSFQHLINCIWSPTKFSPQNLKCERSLELGY